MTGLSFNFDDVKEYNIGKSWNQDYKRWNGNYKLEENPSLTTLNLSNNGLGTDKKIFFIASSCNINASLTSLNLSFNGLSDKDIIRKLAETKFLKHLDLSHNNFSSLPPLRGTQISHGRDVCETTSTECRFATLTSLDISHNKINFGDMTIFEHSPCLTILNLSYNHNTPQFTSTLEFNKSLTILNLSYNGIMKVNEFLFQKNKTLKDLNLAGNKIGNIQGLVPTLKSNKTITTLNVENNTPPVGARTLENINRVLDGNKTLGENQQDSF